MFYVTIHERDGKNPPRYQQVNKDNVLLGRWGESDVVLPRNNVSKKHARLVQKDGCFIITDLQSTNKTYLNGHAIAASSPHVLKSNDRVGIGDYIIDIGTQPPQGMAMGPQVAQAAQAGPRPSPPPPPPQLGTPPAAMGRRSKSPMPQPPKLPQGPQVAPQRPSAFGPAPQAGWQQVAMGQGPSYSYTAIPQGWLLLTPSGDMLFLSDPNHKQPPRAQAFSLPQ